MATQTMLRSALPPSALQQTSQLSATRTAAPQRASTHQPQGQLNTTKQFVPRGPHQSVPDTLNVTGAHRFKYFKRPILPFLNAMPPDIIFFQHQQAGAQQVMSVHAGAEAEPAAKEMATQSDYREMEAQTDPFTPDFWVRPDADPEVLTLSSLTYGNGLPATMQEVKLLEAARRKRTFEGSMPPMTDESSLELRRTMMAEQEMREWQAREADIKELHDGRVEEFAARLRDAAGEVERQWEDRVEHIRQIKLTEKDKALSAIQRQRIKALRKLSDARKVVDVEPAERKRDIVRDYADYSSSVYAPVTRDGKVTQDKLSHLFETDPAQLKGLRELTTLEQSLPAAATMAKIARPPREKEQLTIEERKTKKIRDALEHMNSVLKTAKQAKPSEKEQKEALLAAYRVVKPLERPPTPQTEAPEIDDEIENAAVLLQRLIRGRAVQNMMFEGKERRLELIQELRAEPEIGLEAGEGGRATEEQVQQHEHNEALVSTSTEALQAELVSHTLDFLAKELVRFREERRIADMVRKAELTRRMREAEESGRRQVEQMHREEEDYKWREAMRVYNATADTFLSEIVSDAVDVVAARQAAHEAEVKGHVFDSSAARVQEKHDEAKMIVLDVVSAYLFPEVERQHKHRNRAADDARFGNAAASTADDAMRDAARRATALDP